MSTIIKAAGPTHVADRGSFNFDDMAQRADGYLEAIRGQAREIVAAAHEEAQAIRDQAAEQGRAAALAAAQRVMEEKVDKQLTTLAPALSATIERIKASQADWLMHWEKRAVHLAAAIAGRIVRRELASDPQITLSLVKEALELAAGRGDIQLRLHPDDFAALGKQAERLTADLAQLGTAKVVADPAITKGGCRIDTRFGSIDQQIEAQLARIEEELT